MKYKRYKLIKEPGLSKYNIFLYLAVWIPLKFPPYKENSDLFYSKNSKHFCKLFDNELSILKKTK